MFPTSLNGSEPAGAADRVSLRVCSGDEANAAAFALIYETAFDELTAYKTWLDDNSQNETVLPPGEFPGLPGCKQQTPAAAAVATRDDQPELTPSGSLHKSQLADWMDAHALSRSSHHCAMYCRLGMEAAGLSTGDRPSSGDAGDYGPFLLRHGAQIIAQNGYTPQVGDTVVFGKTEQHPNGHIEIFDGRQWVSDFLQHGFSPYRDASTTPPYTIYRLT